MWTVCLVTAKAVTVVAQLATRREAADVAIRLFRTTRNSCLSRVDRCYYVVTSTD